MPHKGQFYRLINKFVNNNSTLPVSKNEDGAGRPRTTRTQENIESDQQQLTNPAAYHYA